MQWQSNGVLSYFNKLKKFDAFSKPLEDFQEKTIYGGAGKPLDLRAYATIFASIKIFQKLYFLKHS